MSEPKSDEPESEREIDKRMNDALKRALKTPVKPKQAAGAKKKVGGRASPTRREGE